MNLLTQQAIEERMYRGGIARAERMMSEAEDRGEAARNPYGQAILQQFVLPLSAAIKESWEGRTSGRFQAHAALLQPLDADAVAFLAVRSVLNSLLGGLNGDPTLRSVAGAAGTLVHQELVLAQIAKAEPELYFTLANDFNRRRSKDLRHRLTVFKMQARKNGVEWAEWGVGARDQVGCFLVEQLARLGMVELDEPALRADGKRRAGKLAPMMVRLSEPVRSLVDQIKGFVAITSPVYGPCVEQPRPWVGMAGGGFHTPDMQRTNPFLVKAHASARRLLLDHGDWGVVAGAVNNLQATAWRVNYKLVDTIKELAKYRDVGDEVVGSQDTQRPTPPPWLAAMGAEDARTAKQEAEFKLWKRSMAEWYTQRKLRGVKYGRFYSAMKAAEMFRDYPELYFVYFLDSRGRAYPLTYGLNPQGSDLQKALIQFARGKPLLDDAAREWFMIHGANKWGFDKAPLRDRVQWVRDRHDLIIGMARDPHNCDEWTKCDNPLQFLAWAFEYAEWARLGDDFESRIAVSLDGSCNGLQNFSAMLRDQVGGYATNLTDNVERQDIYMKVAEKATYLMQTDEKPEHPELVAKWLQHGIERSAVKRTVMTLPYGITKRSAVVYVVEDYLSKGKCPMFSGPEFYPAAQVLMHYVWEALGEVVVKSREAMDWLKASAKAILKSAPEDSGGVVSWLTPSGFLATQAYYEVLEHRINTKVHGTMKLKVVSEDDGPSSSRHASGLAPNFVHSMDAAHLHLTASAASSCGIDALAMIHDDYGTHAADTQKLYTLLRVQFVDMYQTHDPIQEFAERYPGVPTPPSRGQLDITEVLASEHFFS